MRSKRRYRPPLRISVIIVNYNVCEFLRHALVSLQKAMKGIRGEIIVVDNASDDGSVAMLRKDFRRVKVMASKVNGGFAKANNLALKKAKGEYVLLINPDTIVQEDTLRVMLTFFEENPDVGLAGCKILNPDGSFQLACRRSFPTAWVAFAKISGLSNLFPRSRTFGRYNLTYLSPDESYEVDAVSGSFMMVRNKVVKQVGGLDEDFFMYGEDLDWCFRIQQAGWKNYYVHSTKIIHYKGESTRRSSLDEIGTFYDAMRLFVKKHLKPSWSLTFVLRLGISLSWWMAKVRAMLRPFAAVLIDVVLLVGSLMVAELVRMGELFFFPAYAYPAVYTIPTVLILLGLYGTGVYTYRRMSASRTFIVVFASYVLVAALVAFFKDYAFSRLVILLAGAFSMILLPGWRILMRFLGKSGSEGRKSLFGRRTLLVGVDDSARLLLARLRQHAGNGYAVVGFIDDTRRRVGQMLDGIQIVGSLDNVGKVIHELRISDVIFSTQKLSYTDILSVIGRATDRSVNYHLVPTSLEVMIGKASIDALNELPLVQISYNIHRPLNKGLKRAMDFVLSFALLISAYPFVYWRSAARRGKIAQFVLALPSVLSGALSLVGPPAGTAVAASGLHRETPHNLNLGKPGLTGLVQLQSDRILTPQEVEQLNMYYARNQSLLLDIEILLKMLLKQNSTPKRSGTEISQRRG